MLSNLIINKTNYPFDRNFAVAIQPVRLILGLLILIIGIAFYLVFRDFNVITGNISNLSILDIAESGVPVMLIASLPSFIHVLSFSLITSSFSSSNRLTLTIMFWVTVNVIYELFQIPLFSNTSLISGTADINDVLFACLGGLFAYFLSGSHFFQRKSPSNFSPLKNRRQKNIALCCFVLLGIHSMFGCEHTIEADPIYMSYEELRSPLVIKYDRRINRRDKIYANESFLLFNEFNRGVHVFDNSNPRDPVSHGFIEIPGNTDVIIKSGYLYADSYIDLLVIDLNQIDNIYLISRIENAFPYNSHQNISSDVILFNLDKSKGVVIGHTERVSE